MATLDAFSFSIMSKCLNEPVEISEICAKVTDRITSDVFVREFIAKMRDWGRLEMHGHTKVICTATGHALVKETRKTRTLKLKRKGLKE
ncbi:hypothetical protein [Terasakiella sp.]|uniref:hypothetical protein n=1 Tax=Terasakiella sp. TaxID=2034861 RepID=UPI003AA8C94A